MTKNLDELRRIAEAEPTQKWGRWAVEQDDFNESHSVYIVETGFGTSYVAQEIGQGKDEGKACAEYIATFDPPTVLALIERVEAAERLNGGFAREVNNLTGELNKWKDSYSLQAQELEAAEAAVQRVRAKHAKRVLVYPNGAEEHYCAAEENSAWPCPTIRALDGGEQE